MRFSVGDIVKIRGSGLKGIIHQCEKREIVDYTGSYSIERYFVKTENSSFPKWYHVSLLTYWRMNPEKEKTIDKMLIDVHLKYRQFDVIKGLLDSKDNESK
jgi:hypothetical protein